jgi:nucleotide-binding universal stress UspA family protein
MISRYVVAVDESRPAAAAQRWAVARAKLDGVPIVLVHVRREEPEAPAQENEAEAARLLADHADRLIADEPTLQVSTAVLTGAVPWALASFAKPSDMLVIGTGKTGFLHGRVLGSRSVQIAIAASCSVAVIPDVDLRFRRGVVAGVDRHATAAAIARSAAREATSRGEELLLVQAAPELSTTLTTSVRTDLAIGEAIAEAREIFPDLVIRSRVAGRPAAEALLDSSRDKALLVLGPRSQDPARSPIGSVLHDVLLNVNAPVLISRPAGISQPDRAAATESLSRKSG